jgi:hypothetical protein
MVRALDIVEMATTGKSVQHECYEGRCWKAAQMSHKAHVFLKRPGQKTAKDIGVIEVDPAPGLHVHVTFTQMGKSEVGRINHIEPRDWGSQSSVTPKIVVIQSDGE